MTWSMTDGYDCDQNALAERVKGIPKTEFLLQALTIWRAVGAHLRLERPHPSLKMQTPDAVHRASLAE